MRPTLAIALVCAFLALAGSAEASTLPAGRLFGFECAKASSDPYNCEIALSPRLDSGEAVAVSRDGRFVWAGGADGVLWVFRRGAQGRLTPYACHDSGSSCPASNTIANLDSVDALAPSPDGRDLYALDIGSGGSGRLHVLHVQADGRLSDGGCFDQGSTCGAANSVPALANGGGVAVSGDGNDVYVAAGFGTDAVSIFSRAGNGSLTYDGCVKQTGSSTTCDSSADGLTGAHGIGVSSDGGNVYVASIGANFGGTADGAVAVLDRHDDGSLSENGCVEETGAPFACMSDGAGLVDPYALVATTNAVYIASRDGFDGARSSVTTLTRASGGGLSYGSCFAFTGSSQCGVGRAIPGIQNAFDIVIAPHGTTVHATALGGLTDTGAVTTFTRAASGALSPVGCLGQFDSPESCSRTRVIESAGEALDISPDGASVYAGTASGLAVFGREVAPVCRDATATVPGRTTTVPLPCSDLNGDALSRLPVAGPAHGELGAAFDDAAGTVLYKPEAGYVGPDFLTFRARGGSLTSNVARLTIQVTNRRPSLTRLGLTRKRFRRGRKLPRASRRRARVGTKIRYRLSEPARVTFSFERVLAGRKVGRRCRPPSRRLRSHRRCRRYKRVRTRIRRHGGTGRNALSFQGRLSRRKRLRPGNYRLTVVAKDPQGLRSRRKRVRFTLLR
jgi:DNA-binding beta-propeller fold protein YncE